MHNLLQAEWSSQQFVDVGLQVYVLPTSLHVFIIPGWKLLPWSDLQSPDFKSFGNVRVKQMEFNKEATSDLS